MEPRKFNNTISLNLCLLSSLLLFQGCQEEKHYESYQVFDTPAALCEASAVGDLNRVKELLEMGLDVNGIGQDRFTPLWKASGAGQVEVVKYLLEKKANVNRGCVPLSVPSLDTGWTTDAKKLVTESLAYHSASLSASKTNAPILIYYTPLHIASLNGQIEIVKLLLEAGAVVDSAGIRGCTPLFLASGEGRTEIVKLLIEAKANLNTETIDADGIRFTPYMIAQKNGHPETVKLLQEAGANVIIADENGVTSLNIASQRGRAEIVKLLLEAGVDVNLKTKKDGQTALMDAALGGHSDIVKLLLEAGADVNLKSDVGATPLIVASGNGHSEIVKLLLDAGADVNSRVHIKGKDYTPLSFALLKGHTEIVELLKEHGAVE